MTGLPTLAQFRAIRDAHASAFCEQEIATYTPIEAALAAEVAAVTVKLAHAKKHDKQALESEQRVKGQAWRDASTRLHAAVAMYESLTASHRLPTEVVSFQDVKNHWNATTQAWDDPRYVYIGRANRSYNLPASPYANPFKLAKEDERGATIARYRQWLDSHIHTLDLEPLRGKVLVCWCKDRKHPDRACHGDVLVAALEDVA